ncbi:hypothetical protein D9M70_552210 [compost metagenome]
MQVAGLEGQASILCSTGHDLHPSQWVLLDVAVGLAPVEKGRQLPKSIVDRNCCDGLVGHRGFDNLSQRHPFELGALGEILRAPSQSLLEDAGMLNSESRRGHIVHQVEEVS